jgi:hypothetical protein
MFPDHYKTPVDDPFDGKWRQVLGSDSILPLFFGLILRRLYRVNIKTNTCAKKPTRSLFFLKIQTIAPPVCRLNRSKDKITEVIEEDGALQRNQKGDTT